MGNSPSSQSQSSVYQENNTNVVNQSTINSLSETLNSTTVNTVINNVKQCSAAILNNQTVVFEGIKSAGNIDINVAQNQSAWLDFTCAQTDAVKNDVVAQLVSTIQQNMKSNIDTATLNNLQAIAAAKSTQDFGSFPWGGPSSNSNTTQKINTYISNNQTTNLQTVLQNSVYASFTNSNYDSCIASLVNNQEVTAKNITTGGTLTFTVNQTQSAQLLTSCIQNSNISNRALNDMTSFLGIKVAQDTTTKTNNTSSGTATSTSDNKGVGSLLPDFSSLFSGLSGMFSGLGGVVVFSSFSCCLMLCLLIVFLVLFGFVSFI